MHNLKIHITFSDGSARTFEVRSDQVVWTTAFITIEGVWEPWLWCDIKEINVKVLNAVNA